MLEIAWQLNPFFNLKAISASIFSLLLLSACGNSNESSTTTTANVQESAVTTPPAATTPAPANARDGMKSSMDKMMADLKGYNPTGDPDQDFAAIMRIHHNGAVEMMQAYLPSASDSMLRGMAEKGIPKQQAEIGELSNFLSSHQTADAKSDYGKNAQQMIMDMMKMDNMPDNMDKAFDMMMVPHHESAVHISQMYLSQGKDAKLKAMAKKIASDQQKEASDMKKWMQAHP